MSKSLETGLLENMLVVISQSIHVFGISEVFLPQMLQWIIFFILSTWLITDFWGVFNRMMSAFVLVAVWKLYFFNQFLWNYKLEDKRNMTHKFLSNSGFAVGGYNSYIWSSKYTVSIVLKITNHNFLQG